MSLFMESTKIEPDKTVAEIQAILFQYGATSIYVEAHNREITGLSFTITVERIKVPFRLPCRWEPIFKILQKKRQHPWNKTKEDAAQAKRVAWRQILRWVEAQMALVNTGMVKTEEVFLPYAISENGKTLFDTLESSGWHFKQITAGEEVIEGETHEN